jgi:hypothetical protein
MFYHAMAISFITLSHRKFHQNIIDLTVFLFLGGIAFFTGSLYLLATRTIWGDESYIWLGALTPIGGVLFIAAWVLLISKGFIKSGDEKSTGLIEKKKNLKSESSSNKQVNKKAITSQNISSDKNRTCHRCGNVRDGVRVCPNPDCPQVYCHKCVARIEPELGNYIIIT